MATAAPVMSRLAPFERICARAACGLVFVVSGKHASQRFCSKACKSASHTIAPEQLRRMTALSALKRKAQAHARATALLAGQGEDAAVAVYDHGWQSGYKAGRAAQARLIEELRAQLTDARGREKRLTTKNPMTADERAELTDLLAPFVPDAGGEQVARS